MSGERTTDARLERSMNVRGWEALHMYASSMRDGCIAIARNVKHHADNLGLVYVQHRCSTMHSSCTSRIVPDGDDEDCEELDATDCRNLLQPRQHDLECIPRVLDAWHLPTDACGDACIRVLSLPLGSNTLGTAIRTAAACSERSMSRLFRAAAAALQELHLAGFVQRMISPTSMYVCPVGEEERAIKVMIYDVRHVRPMDDPLANVLVSDVRFCALSSLSHVSACATAASDVEMLCYVFLHCAGALQSYGDAWETLDAGGKRHVLGELSSRHEAPSFVRSMCDLIDAVSPTQAVHAVPGADAAHVHAQVQRCVKCGDC